MKERNRVQIYVHPSFRRKIRMEAEKRDMKVIPFSKILADSENFYERMTEELKEKKKKNDLQF